MFRFSFFMTFLVGVFLSFTGCDMFDMPKTTKDMKDTTDRMAGTTDRMADTTDEMKDTMQNMDKTTDQLKDLTNAMKVITENVYDDSRQAFTAKVKLEFWDAMLKSTSQAGKIGNAGGFMKAMQFQLIRESEVNDPVLMDEVYDESVNEFFRKIQDFIIDRVGLNPDLPLAMQKIDKYTPDLQSLQGLAAAMHLKNRKAEAIEVALKGKFVAKSFLDLVEEALLHKFDDPRGLPKWQESVLYYERLAVYMLNIRANFVQLLAMATLHGTQPLANGLGILTDWEPQFWVLNNVEMKKVGDQLKDALKVQRFLRTKDMGWKVVQNSDFKKKWDLMKPIVTNNNPKTVREQLMNQIRDFIIGIQSPTFAEHLAL